MTAVPSQRLEHEDEDCHRIHLFHGTTLTAARNIANAGWRQGDVRDLVAEVAVAHGHDPDELWSDLDADGQSYATQDGRDQWVSFSPRYEDAAYQWAQRAPEARREALWSVWRLQNPDRSADWPVHVDGHLSVLNNMTDDQPAVVEVSFTYQQLVNLGAMTGGFHRTPLLLEEMLSGDLRIPEIALPAPLPVQPDLRVHAVERGVDWDVFALLLGLPRDEFVEQSKAGKFGPPMPPRFKPFGPATPWWPLSAVEAEMASRGRAAPWTAAPAAPGPGVGHP